MIAKLVVRAGSILAVGRLINMLSQFAFNAILVRVLLKQEVGDFFLTVSFVSFFSLLVSYGGANIAIRRFSEIINQNSKTSITDLLRGFLLVNLIVTFVTICLFLFLYQLNAIKLFKIDYSLSHIFILGCWIWGLGLQAVLTEIFRAFGKFMLTMVSSATLVNSINLVGLAALYIFNVQPSLYFVLFMVATNTVAITILSVVVARKICTNFDGRDSKPNNQNISVLAMQLIKESTPSFINKLGLYFTVLADLWLIAIFFSKDIVADYGIATKLAALLSIFLSIANGFVPTFIGKLKQQGKISVERFLRLSATVVALPTAILFLFLTIKSELVIERIFGLEYVPAATFLSILLLAQLTSVLVGSCGYTLVMDGMNSTLMKISLSTGAAAIIISMILIYLGGGSISIAWAFSLTTITRQLAVYIAARRLCNINTAIYLNPFAFISNLKMMLSKQIQL